MEKVRLAVIGAGGQCTAQLMPAIPYIPELDLVAVCDLQEELAKQNARNFGAKAVYTDYQKMLADEKPDAVMVVGPAQMHEELGIAVMESGCHVFIEKPASPTVEGAKRLVETSKKTGKFGQVGHMMRHADPVRIAWDIAHSSEFGNIISIESKYTTWPTGQIPAGEGWGEPDEDWSYMLIQGGHPIDLMRHFLGQVARVSAYKCQRDETAKVYQVALEGTDGKVGFLNLQDSFNGWTAKLEVVGDNQCIVTVDDLGRVQYRKGECRFPAEANAMGNTAYIWEPHHILKQWQRCGYGIQLQHFAQLFLMYHSTSRWGANPKAALDLSQRHPSKPVRQIAVQLCRFIP